MSVLSSLCSAIKSRQKTHPKEPILLTAAWTRASIPEEGLPTNSTCYAVLDDHVYIPLWTYCGPEHTLLTSSSLPLSTLGHVCAVELEVDVPNGLYIRLHSVTDLTAQSDLPCSDIESMHGPYAICRGVNATVDHVEDQQATLSVQYIYHTWPPPTPSSASPSNCPDNLSSSTVVHSTSSFDKIKDLATMLQEEPMLTQPMEFPTVALESGPPAMPSVTEGRDADSRSPSTPPSLVIGRPLASARGHVAVPRTGSLFVRAPADSTVVLRPSAGPSRPRPSIPPSQPSRALSRRVPPSAAGSNRSNLRTVSLPLRAPAQTATVPPTASRPSAQPCAGPSRARAPSVRPSASRRSVSGRVPPLPSGAAAHVASPPTATVVPTTAGRRAAALNVPLVTTRPPVAPRPSTEQRGGPSRVRLSIAPASETRKGSFAINLALVFLDALRPA